MRLSVATNWDQNLLEKLADYPVHDVYAAMHQSLVGGGRPTFILPAVNKKKVKDYVVAAHDRGIKFTYLLNAPCLNNMEYDRKTHRQLLRYIEWLDDIGVDYVTVTIPFLAEIIKNQFPSLKVNLSVIAHANSVQRVKLFEGLGVNTITLDFNINRDFALLKEIRKAAKCDLMLLLNDPCLYQCPYRYYHYNLMGHASQTINMLGGFYIDYCALKCYLTRFTNPMEIVKARWIRPEDLHLYEKIGFSNFKISGRGRSTEWLLNATNAYSSRRYDGNLLDIIDCAESKGSAINLQHGQERALKMKKTPRYILKALFSFFSRLPMQPYKKTSKMFAGAPAHMYDSLLDFYTTSGTLSQSIRVNNSALDGFIDGFENRQCLSGCHSCDYCEKWAEKVVEIDKNEIDKYVAKLKVLLNKLIKSEFI